MFQNKLLVLLSMDPVIKPHQDDLLGLYKITDDNVFFTKKEEFTADISTFTGKIPKPSFISENGKKRDGLENKL